MKGGKYYLFEKSPAGCYSNPAVIVVNIIPCDCQLVYGVNAGADQEVCAGSPISVTATLTGDGHGHHLDNDRNGYVCQRQQPDDDLHGIGR